MRRIISLLLSVILIFSLAAPAMAATVKQEISATAIKAGEEVTVTVSLDEDVADIVMYQYSLYYDKSLFTMTGSTGSAVVSNPLSDEDGDYFMISFVDTTSEGVTISAGTLAALTFQAQQDMTEEQAASFLLRQDYFWDTSYTDIEGISLENGTVTVTVAPAVTQYAVTLPKSPVGYTITPTEGSASPVDEGSSFSFTVTINEGYEGTPIVKTNGAELTAMGGVYTIENITADQTVTVDGVQEKVPEISGTKINLGETGTSSWFVTDITVGKAQVTAANVTDTDFTDPSRYHKATVNITLAEQPADDVDLTFHFYGLNAWANPIISAEDGDYEAVTQDYTLSVSLAEKKEFVFIVYSAAGNTKPAGTYTVVFTVEGEQESETYDVTLIEGEGYTITAAEGSESPVTEGGSFSFTVSVNNGYEGTPVVKANGSELTAVDGVYTISNINEHQTVTVEGIAVKDNMYTVAASADVTASKGDNAAVSVKVTGYSNAQVTGYNDYDVTVSYDPSVLTYVSASAAHSGAEITHDADSGTIRIVGHGEAKSFSDTLATLNFTTPVSGIHEVTITSAKIDNSGNAIAWDAPEAAISNETTAVKVAYPVTLPENFTGDLMVLPGSDYVFTAPSEYYDITVTVGGVEVTPDVDGLVYTIHDVNGDVVITAVGKTYAVTKSGTNATITGDDIARYGSDYSFSVAADSGYVIAGVSVQIDGTAVDYTINGGSYIISGSKITGDVTITVTTQQQAANTTQITFEGVNASEVVGGLIQYANNGQDFTFELNEEEGYVYTVMLGDQELKPNGGVYTIPGSMINGSALTVTITKEVYSFTPEVNVRQYIQLNETVIWLVTAAEGDTVLAYGEGNTMFWSDKYNAYCYLVVSAESEDAVKQAAERTIIADSEDAVAVQIGYDYDVNQTGAVDINDAQLTYDMYQAKLYSDFGTVTMDKFLEADVNGDAVVNVEDAAAVVAQLLN